MEQGFLLILISISMLSHIFAVVGGIMIVKKYEDYLQSLSHFAMFNPRNFCAQRLWFVLLSLFVSFGFLVFGAEHFIKEYNAFSGAVRLKYILMNFAVGILILQYNFFILKDRRNKRNNKE